MRVREEKHFLPLFSPVGPIYTLGAATLFLKLSHNPALLSRISFMPFCTVGEFNACVLIRLCASKAPMMAFSSLVFRSGELANCSLVLLAACCLSVSDSSSLPLMTLLT
jgi:hypothetical protein